MYLRSFVSGFASLSAFSHVRLLQRLALLAICAAAIPCFAQNQSAPGTAQEPPQSPDQKVTLPAGTHFALVLTHPIQSRYVHRGDDIYAQVNSPVDSGDQMVIPPGTFVQGSVDRLEQRNGRGFLYLKSMAITFSDGYAVPVAGPITLSTNEGYAIKDPGGRRMSTMLLIPAAGAGLGALVGHSVGASQQTITSTLPPGCVGPPPGCLSSSLTVPGNQGMHTAMGAGIGVAAGMIASMGVVFSTRHFYMDAGSPVEMTLERPMALSQEEVAKAVQHSREYSLATQPVAPRPIPPPPPDMPVNHGTCYTPGTPGTPPTVILGAPGADGMPGPPTVIPGTPGMPGAAYPCP